MRIAAPAPTNAIGYPGYALTVAGLWGIITVFRAPNTRLLAGNQGMPIAAPEVYMGKDSKKTSCVARI
jgi:hypothetical protein